MCTKTTEQNIFEKNPPEVQKKTQNGAFAISICSLESNEVII